MGGVLNKDGEISARTFKELNDTHEERQAFQRGMGGIIGRKLGTLDKSEAILKGTLKNKLDKFNQDNGTNISFEDLANPEIRQTISDSQLLTQSENLQKIQKKRICSEWQETGLTMFLGRQMSLILAMILRGLRLN